MSRWIWAVFLLAAALAVAATAQEQQEQGEEPEQELEMPTAVFRSKVRLVEIYATILDRRDKYLTDFTKDSFEVRDNGELSPVVSVEPVSAGFSCAIMLDRTGSVLKTLPTVKNAALRFIDSFRPDDTLAVYGFNTMLEKKQDFTADREAAKREVLRSVAGGSTAIFDSIAEVLRDLSVRKGKKAVVVFTDGADNSSYLTPGAVSRRAKSLGIPLYFIALGAAAEKKELASVLNDISQTTAGEMFPLRKASEIDKVFDKISRDLQNSYLITYEPPSTAGNKWRTIQLSVKGRKDVKIRAREGYFPASRER